MALRLVEMILPENYEGEVNGVLEHLDVLGHWEQGLDDKTTLVRVLVDSDDAESVIEEIESRFAVGDSFRVMLLEVEATLPLPEDKEGKEEPERVAVMELVEKLDDGVRVSRTYLLTVFLSTVVAAAGLLKDNTAVVIGAMVIAPLLVPNMGLALATTLGDLKLARRAGMAVVVGTAVSLAVAVLGAILLRIDTGTELLRRLTEVDLGEVVLALAAGGAGALAFTTGVSATLVGVMVALALLPALVAGGLFLGRGEYAMAERALLTYATSVVCVNLAGVFTFLLQGVRPRLRWEKSRAEQMVKWAVAAWAVLLGVLVVLIWLMRRG